MTNGLQRIGARIEPRTWAVLGSLIVGVAVLVRFVLGVWVPDGSEFVQFVDPTTGLCPAGLRQVADAVLHPPLDPNAVLALFPDNCLRDFSAHFEFRFLTAEDYAGLLRDAAVATVAAFLVITAVRWAWKSYR